MTLPASSAVRILVVNDLYPPNSIGGYEHRCRDMVGWLLEENYEVRVLTTSSRHDSELPGYASPLFRSSLDSDSRSGTTWRRHLRMVRENRMLTREVDTFRPNLIYTWNLEFFARPLVYRLHRLGIPILRDVSSWWLIRYYERPGDWIRFWNRKSGSATKNLAKWLLRVSLPLLSWGALDTEFGPIRADRTYFTANWFRDLHLKAGAESKESKVIHTGIVLKDFPYRPTQPPARNEAVRFLYLGRIAKDKNIEVLVRAFAVLRGDLDYILDMYGDASNAAYLQSILSMIEASQQTGRVRIRPYVERARVPELMSQYHFMLFSSHQEIFSRLIFEAMATGLPVIASNSGGNLEVLRDRENGFLFDPAAPESLADTVRMVWNDEDSYRQVQTVSRRDVEGSFQFEQFATRVNAEIQELVR